MMATVTAVTVVAHGGASLVRPRRTLAISGRRLSSFIPPTPASFYPLRRRRDAPASRRVSIRASRTESRGVNLGVRAPHFELPEPLTGNVWKLDDFELYPALLVMFICNHCPFVIHLKKDIVKLSNFYMKKGLAVVAISSNSVVTHPQDGPEFMAEDARVYKYPFPYLYDESQEVAREFGAVCTPEFFLYKKDGRRPFELVYHGQFDDSRPTNNMRVTGRDLSLAIDCVLSGQPVPSNQKPRILSYWSWMQYARYCILPHAADAECVQLSSPVCSHPLSWRQKEVNGGTKTWKLFCRNNNGDSFEAAPELSPPYSTSDLIRDFCNAINAKDVKKLNLLLAEDCLFMDLIFYMPSCGKQNIIKFLCEVMDAMGPNVHFAIDTLTEQGKFTATVTWHLEWKAKELPFTVSSFVFECEPNQEKLFVRKIIGLEELPVKPGELVLKVLKGTTSMFDNFPMAAEGLLQKMQGKGGGLQMLLDVLASKKKDKSK